MILLDLIMRPKSMCGHSFLLITCPRHLLPHPLLQQPIPPGLTSFLQVQWKSASSGLPRSLPSCPCLPQTHLALLQSVGFHSNGVVFQGYPSSMGNWSNSQVDFIRFLRSKVPITHSIGYLHRQVFILISSSLFIHLSPTLTFLASITK